MGNDLLELLSKNEVAKFLGVSIQTIYNYTANGTLKGYKMGNRKVFYKKNEILEALTEISPK
jgi:excisionase family DNA binding protein